MKIDEMPLTPRGKHDPRGAHVDIPQIKLGYGVPLSRVRPIGERNSQIRRAVVVIDELKVLENIPPISEAYHVQPLRPLPDPNTLPVADDVIEIRKRKRELRPPFSASVSRHVSMITFSTLFPTACFRARISSRT